MSARVFITQLPTRREGDAWVPTVDIKPAEEHGELLFLIPPGHNFPNADMIQEQLGPKLASFGAADSLLAIGDPVVMTVAAAILGARREPFTLLKWDRITKRYHTYKIDPAPWAR